MLITATLLLTLGAIAADLFVWLRRLRREPSALLRRLFAVWCLVSDLLPFSIAIVNWLSHDNTTPVMAFSMWAFWLYLVLVLPRLLYYVFRLCRLPAWARLQVWPLRRFLSGARPAGARHWSSTV